MEFSEATGVVSCGSRLVHTPVALNILASFHPLTQLEKRSGEFRRGKKSSAGFPASGRDHALEAVVRKLGVNRQQSLAREELGNTEEESRNSLTRPRSTDSFNLRAAARMRSILNQRA